MTAVSPSRKSSPGGYEVLKKPSLFSVVTDGARDGAAETTQVRPALDVVNVVGESSDAFIETGVVLHGDVHLDLVLFAVNSDYVLNQRIFSPVKVLDELDESLFVQEFIGLARALVGKSGCGRRHSGKRAPAAVSRACP